MEITNMYEMPIGSQAQRHLEELIGSETEGKIEIWGHKRLIKVCDVDLFHAIAQSVNIDKMSQTGGLNYCIEIPKEDLSPTSFTVALDGHEEKRFIEKYGKIYRIG